VLAAALFLTTVLVFSRAIGHGFVNYDDPDYVTANAHVQAGLSWDTVRWALGAAEASNWHPLTWLSHAADVSWFGRDARGHHATSVLLHGCDAALAFLALFRLTGARWTSALAAALFAWHPLRVESVAWVAERKDVLSGVCWFLALWAYAVHAERRRSGARPGLAYALALAAFALGLMAKPMLVTLPCVLLLLDVWPLRRLDFAGGRGESVWRLVAEKLPFLALAAASSVVTYLVQSHGGSVSAALGPGQRLANAGVAVAAYLGNFLWPTELAVLYPHPGTWPAARVAVAAVLLLSLTALAWWQRSRRPWLGVGWLWFVGTLVPVLGLVQVGLQCRADRYTYLPIIGVELALLWSVREFVVSVQARRRAALISAAVLLVLVTLTWRQLAVWRDSLTLFDQALAVTRGNYVAHDNRGYHLASLGRLDDALAAYRQALALRPDYLNANNNLGHALIQLGRPAEAVPPLRAALAANPEHLEVRNNLANALSDLGQLGEAMEQYEFVLARRPRHANALNGSGVVLAMQDRLTEARARLEAAVEADPALAGARQNLGNVCAMLGLRDDAVRAYLAAHAVNPADAQSLVRAGLLLVELGKLTEAVDAFRRALAVGALNPEAHAGLGLALAKLGRRDEALRSLETALRQQPDLASARAWLEALRAEPPRP
jgi:tetratricopeptide (TPR) repeat protein